MKELRKQHNPPSYFTTKGKKKERESIWGFRQSLEESNSYWELPNSQRQRVGGGCRAGESEQLMYNGDRTAAQKNEEVLVMDSGC